MTAGLSLALAVIFFADDVRGLAVPVRFAAQFAAAISFVALTGGYPGWLLPFLVVGLVWSMNLYNFMDGANGLAGSMAVIGFGALAIAAALAGASDLAVLSGVVAAAAFGFLVWNWDPARIFLGDAGSIPLGFLAAAIGVLGWQRGVWPFWFPALVFAVFIVDSGVTLAKRVAHGEKPWEAHRSHYYQRLVRMGWSHQTMSSAAAGLMAASAASAILLLGMPMAIVAVGLACWGGGAGTRRACHRSTMAAVAGARRRHRRAGSARSVGRASAGNVEHLTCRERAVLGGREGDEGRDLLDLHEAGARDLREHEVDVLLRDLVEDRRPRSRGRDGIDGDVLGRQLLRQRLGQADDARFRG